MDFKNNTGSTVDIVHFTSLPDMTPLYVGLTYDLFTDRAGNEQAMMEVNLYTDDGLFCGTELNLRGGVKPFPKTHLRSLKLPEGKTLTDLTMIQPDEEESTDDI